MERLTKRIDDSVYYTKGRYKETLCAEMETREIRECMKKLACYEDIGTLDELKDIENKYKRTLENLLYVAESDNKDSYACKVWILKAKEILGLVDENTCQNK